MIRHILRLLSISMALAAAAEERQPALSQPPNSKRVHDLISVWGNPEMTTLGGHAFATYAEASPVQRARLLGRPNIVMAGKGLPNDDEQADRLTRGVLGLSR